MPPYNPNITDIKASFQVSDTLQIDVIKSVSSSGRVVDYCTRAAIGIGDMETSIFDDDETISVGMRIDQTYGLTVCDYRPRTSRRLFYNQEIILIDEDGEECDSLSIFTTKKVISSGEYEAQVFFRDTTLEEKRAGLYKFDKYRMANIIGLLGQVLPISRQSVTDGITE